MATTPRTRSEATWTIGFHWNPVRKAWHLRAADRYGNVVRTEVAKSTHELEYEDVALLLRALRYEVEQILPFS